MRFDDRSSETPRPSMSSPAHEGNRTVLRAGGVVAVIVGGLFLLVGGIDFFSAFGTFHSPTKFWCFFVGIPLLALGANLLRMGYLGAVSRYMAAETVPVIRDSAVEVAEGLRPTVRGIVSDLRASGQPDAPAGDPATRLARLEKLRSDGLISEAEHADQRARILREL